MKILMVCLGNICRSPIAEGVLRQMAGKKNLPWQIDSAGTGAHCHEHSPPHPHSIMTCAQKGIDISKQKARLFKHKDLYDYDLIYALDEDIFETLLTSCKGEANLLQKVKLLRNEVNNLNESVPDPYYGTESSYPPVYKMIEEACTKIIERYSKEN